MMSRVERFIVNNSKSAGGQGASEEGTDKAWGVSNGDGVDVINGKISVFEGLIKNRLDGFDMRACGDFGDDAAIFGMDIYLGDDDVRQNMSAIFDNGGGGFITG
jgi:hypothetical protein